MNYLKPWLGRSNEQVICFLVQNYEEMSQQDPEIITRLETNLAAAGAIPAKIDFPSKMCCVTVANKDLYPNEVQRILEDLGYRVALINDKEGTSNESA